MLGKMTGYQSHKMLVILEKKNFHKRYIYIVCFCFLSKKKKGGVRSGKTFAVAWMSPLLKVSHYTQPNDRLT